jgi:hypothetical protein
MVCTGLGLLAKHGMADTEGVNVLTALLPFGGVVAGGVVGLKPGAHAGAGSG